MKSLIQKLRSQEPIKDFWRPGGGGRFKEKRNWETKLACGIIKGKQLREIYFI